jgi:CO dehydrogenase/acetyl-CoA synthase delta subunit
MQKEILPCVPPAGGEIGCKTQTGAVETACCGGSPAQLSSPHERPGYRLCSFVKDVVDTPAGSVPLVHTEPDQQDRIGTLAVRVGINRDNYRVAPGLYGIGRPDDASPVLVTANYKLTFDALRREMGGQDAWVLVLDTMGVNVWCAAGKGTFSTDEVIRQVERSGIARVVAHRRLILPQLGATGVSSRKVKKGCGFEVVWGPVRISDIRAFLDAGMKAETHMRRVSFTTAERLVLIPVELSFVPKPLMWVALAAFLISGIGPGLFSLGDAWVRGWMVLAAFLTAVAAGAVVTPALLPWIPGTAFAVKGALVGAAAGMLLVLGLDMGVTSLGGVAILLCTLAMSSFLAMNFTGSTPFTSPSGVEKEMRRAIPLQLAAVLAAAGIWVGAAFG